MTFDLRKSVKIAFVMGFLDKIKARFYRKIHSLYMEWSDRLNNVGWAIIWAFGKRVRPGSN